MSLRYICGAIEKIQRIYRLFQGTHKGMPLQDMQVRIYKIDPAVTSVYAMWDTLIRWVVGWRPGPTQGNPSLPKRDPNYFRKGHTDGPQSTP
ncbi:hypothetical protein D0962_28790 [Leptolyngbyaceae cyanobacterium CCMR0082]|uniref:Uncharacterized protein n=1 Tax=Adonisia turfae CCMR0082 TaxID=2304604 RepID=A0A6M0SDZ3_9CYAN|nr:hypothetical protein [Adonisia turfae CCMR0082]